MILAILVLACVLRPAPKLGRGLRKLQQRCTHLVHIPVLQSSQPEVAGLPALTTTLCCLNTETAPGSSQITHKSVLDHQDAAVAGGQAWGHSNQQCGGSGSGASGATGFTPPGFTPPPVAGSQRHGGPHL